MSAMGRPEAEAEASLAAMRQVFLHALGEGRTSLMLMLRAEIDGLAPERLLEGSPLRPLVLLRAWLAGRAPEGAGVDVEALTMVVGAAMMGLASCAPMLASGAGAQAVDQEELVRRCVDVLVGVAAVGIGAGPEALGPGSHRLTDAEDA
jgi:hypothetical protein